MESDKTSVDILKNIAKRAGWEINIKEETINSRHGHRTRNVVIRNYEVRDSYFISAQMSNFDKYRVYSGIFFPVSGYDNYKLLIRKRDQLDKFSFRKNRLRFKIGNSSFDSKVQIDTNNDIDTHKLLSSLKIQLEIIEYLNTADRLYVGFNEINPDFNKDLEGKKFLSVFMAMGWMLDRKQIDKAYKLGDRLRSKFN